MATFTHNIKTQGVKNANIQLQRKEIWKYTYGAYIRDLSRLSAHTVNMPQLQKEILTLI